MVCYVMKISRMIQSKTKLSMKYSKLEFQGKFPTLYGGMVDVIEIISKIIFVANQTFFQWSRKCSAFSRH